MTCSADKAKLEAFLRDQLNWLAKRKQQARGTETGETPELPVETSAQSFD